MLAVIAFVSSAAAQQTPDERFATLREQASASMRNPGDLAAGRVVARILSELGGYHGAASFEQTPTLATRAGQAAEWVRWGSSIPADSPAKRFAATDRALSMLDELAVEARAAGDRAILARVLGDRAVALRDRERWADALAQLAGMRAEALPVRPYLREAEADALLALRRPQPAHAIYVELATADPANRNAHIGRFYAEVELEDFEAALRTADALGDPVLAAQARHYAGLDSEAWARIRPLLETPSAPGYVHSAAASIANARGWPRFAHDELVSAVRLAPGDAGIAVAMGQSYLRRRDLERARAIEMQIAQERPGDAGIHGLTRELRDFDAASWQVEVRGRQESGGAASAPGPGTDVAARAWTPPWRNAFRFFAGTAYATARPPEGRAERSRAGGGVEWRGADASFEASAWANGADISRPGAAASGSWSPDDHWTLSGDYERYSWDTPLRAVLHGITSDGGGVGVGYAWHESRAAWAGYREYDFDDGNHRRSYRLAWAERVVDALWGSVTLRPAVYGSRNSLAGAPYFNPVSDRELSLAVDYQGVVWRRYEESLRHRVVVRAARYHQEGYADGWVGSMSYEQAWQPHSRLELRWGVEAGRARYDGANENVAIVFLAASGRF